MADRRDSRQAAPLRLCRLGSRSPCWPASSRSRPSAGLVDSMPLASGRGARPAGATVLVRGGRSPTLNASSRRRRRRPAGCSSPARSCLVVQLARADRVHRQPERRRLGGHAVAPWQSRHSCVSSYWVAAAQVTTDARRLRRVALQPAAGRSDGDAPRSAKLGRFSSTTTSTRRRSCRAAAPGAGRRRTSGASAGSGSRSTSAWSSSLAVPSRDGSTPARHARGLADAVRHRRAGDHRDVPGRQRPDGDDRAAALAMYCFDRRRHAAGGALLAFAIVGKLYPGVLRALSAAAPRLAAGGLDGGRSASPCSPRLARRRRLGAVPRLPARDARADERRGLLGVPESRRHRRTTARYRAWSSS